MSNRWKGGFIQAFFDPLTVGPANPFGALYSWGDNSQGELGLDDTTARSSPVQVGSLTTWSQVEVGEEHAAVIKTDGSLWTWGESANGRLGHNNVIDLSSPVQVGALTNWSQVATLGGGLSTAAIKDDGTLWTWGNNSQGRLGHNNTTYLSSPVQVGALTDWYQISAHRSMAAIKTDGTLWAWGPNASGQIGDGTRTNRLSPVQIGALTTWAQVSTGSDQTAAIKTDGTLWSWGSNDHGKLGLNIAETTDRSSPVQVGALTNWAYVAMGRSFGAALKTDGTLWAWGYNLNGSLGDGTNINRSSPVQVSSDTDWGKISSGSWILAIKTDNSLWSWGPNSQGGLGLDDTIDRSSPVQVGSLTTWSQAAAGRYLSAAIESS